MKFTGPFLPWKRQGSALVLSLVFIAVFAGVAEALEHIHSGVPASCPEP